MAMYATNYLKQFAIAWCPSPVTIARTDTAVLILFIVDGTQVCSSY